jgi:hypothetical protein
VTRKETEEAQELARAVAKKLPLLQERMKDVAGHAEIRLGSTFAEWGSQLKLLVAVRESLDKFTPDIFDRPVTDLISATASSSWRRERGIDMASMQRSRLRRVAKEYVRRACTLPTFTVRWCWSRNSVPSGPGTPPHSGIRRCRPAWRKSASCTAD